MSMLCDRCGATATWKVSDDVGNTLWACVDHRSDVGHRQWAPVEMNTELPTSTASQPPNRWNTKAGKQLPSDPRIEAFLGEIEQVCRKHGMTISHEDGGGGFEIEGYDDINIDWLRSASDARGDCGADAVDVNQ